MVGHDLESIFLEDLFELIVSKFVDSVHLTLSFAIPGLLVLLYSIVTKFFSTSVAVHIFIIVLEFFTHLLIVFHLLRIADLLLL
jgi:hypothetical protein